MPDCLMSLERIRFLMLGDLVVDIFNCYKAKGRFHSAGEIGIYIRVNEVLRCAKYAVTAQLNIGYS